MRGRDNLLFYGNDLSQVLQANLEGAKNDVDQIPEDQFINSSDEDIVEHVYSRREVIPIELHEDRKVMETQETKVDVRHDFNRFPVTLIYGAANPALTRSILHEGISGPRIMTRGATLKSSWNDHPTL